MLYVCLFILYDQDDPFLDLFFLFVVIVVVAFIVFRNHLLGMDWLVVIPLGTITCLPEGGEGVDVVSFVKFSPLIRCHCCWARSSQELPIWEILVCRNPCGHYHMPSGGNSRPGWVVLCRVSFVQLYRLFCCCYWCANSCPEPPFWKVCVCCNPSGHYHLRPGREERSYFELS